MPFNFNPKSVTLLFLFVHAFIFGVLILYKGVTGARSSSKWLGVFLILAGLYIFPFMTGYGGWYSLPHTREVLFYVPFQNPLLIAPVMYLYFNSLMNDRYSPNRKIVLHFIPGSLYLIYSMLMFIADEWLSFSYKFYGDARDRDFDLGHQSAGFISLIIYGGLSFRKYTTYITIIQNTLSYAEEVKLRWVRNFMVTVFVLLALRLLFFITNPEWDNFGDKFWYYLIFGGIIYYLSIQGLSHLIRLELVSSLHPDVLPGQSDAQDKNPNNNDVGTAKTVDLSTMNELKEKVSAHLATNQSFRNSRLTVSDLAKEIDVPAKRLSQMINEAFGMNFNDLINSFRVNDVLTRIDRGDLKSRTVLGLAEEAGFNSKSTFNRVFKKMVHVSPKEYAAKVQKRGTKSGSGTTTDLSS